MLPSKFFLDDMFEPMESDHGMKCDIYEKDGIINIEADIPGFNKEDIELSLDKGNLTITAIKKHEEHDGKKYYRRERRIFSKNVRSFYLGEVDEEKIKAKFENGILKVTVPKLTKTETKKMIEIK